MVGWGLKLCRRGLAIGAFAFGPMRILYVTTSFPVFSETFLQREVRALLQEGVELRIVSLHGGEESFEGHPVERFSKWSLLRLTYLLPIAFWRHGSELSVLARQMNARRPASALNLLENLLGFGAAIVQAARIRAFEPDMIHGVWASAPAAYAMVASALGSPRFSMGAHAYDLFEFGGDWLLGEKARRAILVHVSTDVAAKRVRQLCDGRKVARIRRGLSSLPRMKEMRTERSPLRIVCLARLVEKKGFPFQVAIYRALLACGLEFEARIVGDGPLANWLRRALLESGLANRVRLLGRVSEREAMEQLQWADALFHTGVVAASGDRDGLPNVVPEAMASGTLVVSSPVSGAAEAIEDEETGFLRAPSDADGWVDVCRILQVDTKRCAKIQRNARAWVEREFLAKNNTRELIRSMRRASSSSVFSHLDLRDRRIASN